MSETMRIIGTAGGALGLGTFAAAIGACCGLPWAVAVLGVSGAVALVRLSFLFAHLDSHVFAHQVQILLAQMPTSTDTAAPAHQVQE